MSGETPLYRYMDNPWHFRVLRGFLVEEGLRASPELRALDEAIAAQERTLVSARRAYWAPLAVLQGEVSRELAEGGAGSGGGGGDPPLPPEVFTPPDETSWSLGLRLSLPLFQGGARSAAVTGAREELQRLRLERQATAERIEQRIRSAAHGSGASFAGIRLSRSAAGAARENLELVGDAYGRGVVSILDLLDAQNAALVADEAAANAVYDFLIDLFELERAVSRVLLLLSDEEKAAFFRRLERHFEEVGEPPGARD